MVYTNYKWSIAFTDYDSLHCTTVAYSILYNNFTSKKTKKKKKKRVRVADAKTFKLMSKDVSKVVQRHFWVIREKSSGKR